MNHSKPRTRGVVFPEAAHPSQKKSGPAKSSKTLWWFTLFGGLLCVAVLNETRKDDQPQRPPEASVYQPEQAPAPQQTLDLACAENRHEWLISIDASLDRECDTEAILEQIEYQWIVPIKGGMMIQIAGRAYSVGDHFKARDGTPFTILGVDQGVLYIRNESLRKSGVAHYIYPVNVPKVARGATLDGDEGDMGSFSSEGVPVPGD